MLRPMAHHPHNMAHGLASLGRGGDSMLVHMSPAEVGGLQKLATATGGSLTTNPHTGLPEAGWLSSLLPLVGGVALDAFAPDFASSYAPEIAVGTGLIDKAMGGSLSDAVSAGMGMYSGLETGQSLQKMGTPKVPTLSTEASDAANATAEAQAAAFARDATPASAIMNDTSSLASFGDVAGQVPQALQPEVSTGGFDITAPDVSSTAPGMLTPPSSMGDGLYKFVEDPIAAAKSFYANLGEGPLSRNIALMGGINALSNTVNAYQQSHQPTIPAATSNQNEWYVPAPGQTSLFRPGKINPDVAKYGYLPQGEQYYVGQGWNPGVYTSTAPGMKAGGLASLRRFDAGGPTGTDQAELQSMNDYYKQQLAQSQNAPMQMNQPTPSPDDMNAYLARLNQMITPFAGNTSPSATSNWSWQGGATDATGTTSAAGVTGARGASETTGASGANNGVYGFGMNSMVGGMSMPTDSTVEATTSSDTGGATTTDTGSATTSDSGSGSGVLGDIGNAVSGFANSHPGLVNTVENMGLNAIIPGAGTVRSLYQMYKNPPNWMRSLLGMPSQQMANFLNQTNAIDNVSAGSTMQQEASQNMDAAAQQAQQDAQNAVNNQQIDISPVSGNGGDFLGMSPLGQNADVMSARRGGRIHHMAHGGLADLVPTYAAGGKLLRGPGDGMSDSIPAVIHGNKPQRAALADGEFVIPADVVSHLGNGSTEAGSRKLYAMMDKVRHARTGNKKQGKQINSDKFLPV